MRVLSIGAGNNQKELEEFRREFEVAYLRAGVGTGADESELDEKDLDLDYYSEEDFIVAERKFLKFALLQGESATRSGHLFKLS